MSETREVYESGAPAPSPTCPTCGAKCTATPYPHDYYGNGVAGVHYEPIPTPAPDPLTELERRVVEEAVAYIDCPGMKPDLKRLQVAVGLLQNAQYLAARAAAGQEGAQ